MDKGSSPDHIFRDSQNSKFTLNPRAIRYLFEDCSFVTNCTKSPAPLEREKQEALVSILSKFGSTGRDFIEKYSRKFEGRNKYNNAEKIIASFNCKNAYSCKKINKKWPCFKSCGVNNPTELAHERTPPAYPNLSFKTEPPENDHSILPERFYNFVSHIAGFYKAPWALVLTSSLTALSIATRGNFLVELPDQTKQCLCIYAIINSSNTDKDAIIITFFRNFFAQYESILSDQYKESLSELKLSTKIQQKIIKQKYKIAAQTFDKTLRKSLIKDIKQLEKALPSPIYEEKIITDNITPKAFIKALENNAGRIGIMDPEGHFLESLNGRSIDNVNRLSLLLKHSSKQDDIRITSNKGNTQHISILTVANYEIIHHFIHSRHLNKRGIINCFLYINQREGLIPAKIYDPKEISPNICSWYASKINALLLEHHSSTHIENQPITLKMATDAISPFNAYISEIDNYRKHLPNSLRSWINRMPALTAKLSGLLHLATSETLEEKEISKSTMIHACSLASYFMTHALSMICSTGADPKTECAKEIYNWIRKNKLRIFYAREALRHVRSRYPTMDTVRDGLKYLEDRRIIYRVEPEGHRGPGARPSALYRVHPEAIKAIERESQIYEIKFFGQE